MVGSSVGEVISVEMHVSGMGSLNDKSENIHDLKGANFVVVCSE